MRIRAPYSLERYVDVVQWDDGYLVFSHTDLTDSYEPLTGAMVGATFVV